MIDHLNRRKGIAVRLTHEAQDYFERLFIEGKDRSCIGLYTVYEKTILPNWQNIDKKKNELTDDPIIAIHSISKKLLKKIYVYLYNYYRMEHVPFWCCSYLRLYIYEYRHYHCFLSILYPL
jgi:hypothetical protein